MTDPAARLLWLTIALPRVNRLALEWEDATLQAKTVAESDAAIGPAVEFAHVVRSLRHEVRDAEHALAAQELARQTAALEAVEWDPDATKGGK